MYTYIIIYKVKTYKKYDNIKNRKFYSQKTYRNDSNIAKTFFFLQIDIHFVFTEKITAHLIIQII